jgi:3-hydroxybutyryl-CoA dehydratase
VQGLYFDELSIGQTAEMTKVVEVADVEAFAAVSHDHNPIHLDEAYAKTTPFGGRIAHGALGGAYISAVMGNQLPGPGVVYLSQSLKFRRPVRIGDPVTTRVTVTALDSRRGYATLRTVCEVNGKTVIDGEAMVIVPRRDA